jgi:hypothetical protein
MAVRVVITCVLSRLISVPLTSGTSLAEKVTMPSGSVRHVTER